MKNLLSQALISLVKFYRFFLSPLCPGVCRYRPTCSEYMIEALRRHGPFKGSWLGLKRILRCHPWGGSGDDPVPPAKEAKRPESDKSR